MQVINLAFFDDHPVLLEGMVGLFSDMDDYNVVAKGCCAAEVVEISLDSGAQAVILDLDMPGDVFEAIRCFRKQKPEVKILIFTASDDIEQAVKALEVGASGYVLKGSRLEDLVLALRSVMKGETYITQQMAARVIMALRNASMQERSDKHSPLSVREQQVVKLLLQGKTNREIAQTLTISEKTVKHYMTVLMQKLHVRNRVEVVLAAQRNMALEHQHFLS
nr:response regulator transcription factor [Nitratireductor basaltis]